MANKKKRKKTAAQKAVMKDYKKNIGPQGPQPNITEALGKIAKAAQTVGPALKPALEQLNRAAERKRANERVKALGDPNREPKSFRERLAETQRNKPLQDVDTEDAKRRAESLVEKLSRPPETVLQHVERLGATIAVREVYWLDDDSSIQKGPLLAFVIPYEELVEKESAYLSNGGELGKVYPIREHRHSDGMIGISPNCDPAVDDVPTVGPVVFEKPKEYDPNPTDYPQPVRAVGPVIGKTPEPNEFHCVCGEPDSLNTVHRSDGPCYVKDPKA